MTAKGTRGLVGLAILVLVGHPVGCDRGGGGGGGGGVAGTPPTISNIADQTTDQNVATAAIPFTVADAETAAASLTVAGSSSNPALVPDANIVFGGSGADRTVTLTPASNQFGLATITVTVSDADGGIASDTFRLAVNPAAEPTPPPVGTLGTATIRHFYSSVDGVPNMYLEYLPAGYDPAQPYPLLAYLHGGGPGMKAVPQEIHQAADTQQYIVISIDGRALDNPSQYSFNISDPQPSPFYFNSPITGPGEQDVLDMIADAQRLHSINLQRRYLAGFSMGGWGTWGIGFRNPGLFAAIAPGAGPTDGFNMQQGDFAKALGGLPTDSDPVIATRWLMIGARWLIDNAMNTPVHAFHCDDDTSVPNRLNQTPPRYAHSHHLIDTPGWTDPWGAAITLNELAALYPGYYVGEGTYPATGGHNATNAFDAAILYAFLNQHKLDTNPLEIALKTYDDVHETAYWGRIDIASPWSKQYGRFRARRVPAANSFSLQADGASTITLDLAAMQLVTSQAVTFQVGPSGAYAGSIVLGLTGPWSGNETLKRDGLTLAKGVDYTVGGGVLTVNSFSIATSHDFEVVP